MGLFSFLTTRPLQWRIDGATLLADDTFNTRFINRVKEKHPEWSRYQIECIIDDYKKFMYIAASSDESCTPSKLVDIIWHEHILFTRDYINHWCGKVLKKVIHHDPGTPDEQPKFKSAYEKTQAKIKKTYGSREESVLPDVADSLGDALGAIMEHTSYPHSSHNSHHSSDHGHSSHDSGGSHGHSSCSSSGGHSSCSSGSSCSSSSCGSSCGGGGD